ncbi:hypothetical protein KDA23_02465 [Candidatus Saccharibacteria bacterium]|nr:hypothetical protein [Candidatus Saccharibacteria bacterium]
MKNVVDLALEPKSVIKRARHVVNAHSARVKIPTDIHTRAKTVDVSISEVWRCLEEGQLTQAPVRNGFSHICIELSAMIAGRSVLVTAALDETGDHAVLHVTHADIEQEG